MDERRAGIIASLAVLGIAALVATLLLLRSYEAAIALYIIGFAVALSLIEPFAGLIIYLAYVYIRPHEFIPALHGARLMLIVGGATFASMVVRRALRRQRLGLFESPQDRFMWWFFAAILVSHLSQLDFENAFRSGYEFLSRLIFYFLVSKLISSEKKLRVFTGVFVVLTIVLAVQGIVQNYTGIGIGGQTLKDERIQSLAEFGNPNALAMALLVALPFLFFDLINSRRMATRVCLIAGLSVILFALYLTNSRGAMVGLGGMATVLFIRNVGWPKGVALGAAVFALIVLLGPSRMTTISPTEPSAYGRIQAWKTGFELLKSHPFFGVGAQAWGGAKYASAVAHNSFVHCAAELGLFGLPAWVMLIFVSVKNMNFVSRRVSVTVPKTVNLFGEKVFFACLGWVVPMLFISKTYSALLYILIGLAVATTKIFVEKSEEEYVVLEKRDWLYGALITIAGLVVFKLFVIIIGV